MDEIDFIISKILMVNSRTPYKELADLFHISVNSIHKRIKSLVKNGVIRGFKASLGFANFPNLSNIIMYGFPEVKDKKKLMDVLGRNEYVYNVTRASGNLFYIHAYIRNTSELDLLTRYVRNTGKFKELMVGIDRNIPSITFNDNNKLSDMDYLIINSLRNNSRKSIVDVALEVGASTKTVRRRLDRITDDYLVQFQLEWYPDNSGDIISTIILKVNPDLIVDSLQFVDKLKQKYGPKILFTWAFSNLPNIILLCIWSESMKELQDIESSLLNENLASLEVTILIEGKMYSTWIDSELENKVQEIKLSKT